ncbi:MAG: 4Fe-4S binding protein [Candidatus Omnitrophica bacterium]|nr:4Fe-4S binding protein [Candidatus Omnitrophota bacterium]MCM8807900.1 4Fe-4S binding protein [Candidatus Omnitrophota bacterium]
MDILMTVFTTLSTLYFSILLLPSLFILFMLILFGNFFCYWLCPVGGIIDITNILLLRKKWKIRIKNPIFLHKIKILIFSGILLTALISNFVKIPFLFWIFDPFVIITRSLVFKKMLLVFLLIIFISILIPRFWCNNICPLGYLNYLIGVKLRNKIKKLKR